jgi:hypothetical protein
MGNNVGGQRPSYDYNIYNTFTSFASISYTTYTFSNWRSAFAQDSHSMNSDPLYTNEFGNIFTLQPSSPARNAGIDILDLDNDGSTTDPITLGAYITGNEVIGIESGGGDTTPPSAPSGLSVS